MEIQWHGLSCFSLNGKSASLVTDPYDAKATGLKPLKLSADVCLSNEDSTLHHGVSQLGKETMIFDWPGEYEAKNIIIQAIAAYDRPRENGESEKDSSHHVLIFSIQMDGFKICHLSNIGHKLTPEMLEAIGDIDILFIPVGGAFCLDAKKAHEVIEQVDPRVVIPMYYKLPGLKLPLGDLEPFLKEVGLHSPQREKNIKFLSRANLPQEQTEFLILEVL